MDLGSSPETLKVAAAALAVAAAGVSVAVYRRDREPLFFNGKKQEIARVQGARATILLTQLGMPVVVGLSLTLHPAWLLPVFQGPLSIGCGLALGGVGLGLFLAAKKRLGSNYTPCFNAYLPHGLTTSGVYAKIRHPIYTANLLLAAAGFLLSGSLIALVLFLALFRLYAKSARTEEAALEASFPDYADYMKQTGRFFLKV